MKGKFKFSTVQYSTVFAYSTSNIYFILRFDLFFL